MYRGETSIVMDEEMKAVENALPNKLYVGNLAADVSLDSIRDILNLSATEELKTSSIVDLIVKKNGKGAYAFVTVPEKYESELLKLDGTDVNGKKLKVKIAEHHPSTTQNSSSPGVTSVTSTSAGAPNTFAGATMGGIPPTSASNQMEQVRKYIELDATVYFDCYSIPEQATIVYAVSKQFNDDRTKSLYPLYPGVWSLETKNIDMYQNVQHLVLNGQNLAKLSVRTIKSYVDQSGKVVYQKDKVKENRESDLLLTLFQAATEKFEKVPQDDILRKIADIGIGDMKKGLTQQLYRESDIPNGNLFFVLTNVNKADLEKIPHAFEFLTEDGPLRMWVNFKGKKRKCFTCNEIHDQSSCPLQEKWKKMCAERDAIKASKGGHFKVKTLGASTLRHMCQDAVASEVHVMSGATTCHLLNAVEADKSNEHVENFVIVGGQNELNPRHSKEEFLWMLKNKTERLAELASKKKVAVVALPPQGFVDAENQVREQIFNENLKQLATMSSNIKIWENPLPTYSNDNGLHPSQDETNTLVKFLDEKIKEEFKEPYLLSSATDDVTTTDKIYKRVKSLYKYGCAACPSKARNKWPLLCDQCVQTIGSSEGLNEAVNEYDERVAKQVDLVTPSLPSPEGQHGIASAVAAGSGGPPVEKTSLAGQKFRDRSPITETKTGNDDGSKSRNYGKSNKD